MADIFGHADGPSVEVEPEVEALTEIPGEPGDAILAEQVLAES
jgi:hypothetical protein